MEDADIVTLYWDRSEEAVAASMEKYGGYCAVIARNILGSGEDAEECVNDLWLRVWNAIPPDRPKKLSAYFGSVIRNLALDRRRQIQAEKAGGGTAALCLDELAEAVGEEEDALGAIDLRDALDRFLETLGPNPREIFMRRYWAFQSEREIARALGITAGGVRLSLSRTRKLLKQYLTGEDAER